MIKKGTLLWLGFVGCISATAVILWIRPGLEEGLSSRGEDPSEMTAPQTDLAVYEKLVALHEVKRPPGPYDWLAHHDEPGQTFSDFVQSQPLHPDESSPYLDILLLGDFTAAQRELVDKTSRYIEAYYQLPVRVLPPETLDSVPAQARRIHPRTGDHQVLSTYVLDHILNPRKATDAFGLIAFTSSDLWPGAGWNFVFGQASLDDRTGVWSIYRNGNPEAGPQEYDVALKRTVATGVHEVGHMFGMHHCIYYECLMNGSNHRQESDSRPLWLCPVCLRKLQWSKGFDLKGRYDALQALAEDWEWEGESMFYHRARELTTGP